MKASLSDLSTYIVRYPHAHDRFDGWRAGLSSAAVCNGRSDGRQEYNNSHKTLVL